MLRKALLSTLIALFSLFGVALGVWAQANTPQANVAQTSDDEDVPAVTVQPVVAAATMVQSVPVTLTLTIPGPTGPLTIEVPIFLSLDIRIGISPELTTTLEVTPSVVTVVTPEVGATVTSTVAAATSTSMPTPVPTTAPTTIPTATAIPPTESEEVPAEADPTEVPLPTATPTATVEPEPVIVAPACTDPRSLIIAPGVGQVVSGVVNILGTATHENFMYYKLEYAPGTDVDPSDTFAFLGDARVQVTGSVLGSFDSTNFDNGSYTIKLTVVDNSGNFPPPCTVSIVIEN